jgi:transcriptional regulator with XRE-family HTH domain
MGKHPWAEMFRAWCAESGETQGQLAERIGVTQSVVSAWSTGKRVPSETWQQTIAELTADKVPTMVDGYRRGVGLCVD